MQKNKSRKLLIILPILLVLLLVIVFLAIKVNTLKHHADDIKTDLKVMAACIKEKDPESAEKALAKSYKDCDALEETLSNSFWQTAAKIPRVKREIEAGEELIGILRTAQDKLLTPLIALMKEKPLTGLKVGDNGFNVRLILSYLDFIESVNPELLSLTEQIQNISTDSFSGGLVGKYKDKIQSLMEMYSKASAYLPVVRAILGNGEDKYYLLTAQNSAEIRASGGFPGSIGTIKITNGLLTIGDFKGVNSVISDSISEASEVTDKKRRCLAPGSMPRVMPALSPHLTGPERSGLWAARITSVQTVHRTMKKERRIPNRRKAGIRKTQKTGRNHPKKTHTGLIALLLMTAGLLITQQTAERTKKTRKRTETPLLCRLPLPRHQRDIRLTCPAATAGSSTTTPTTITDTERPRTSISTMLTASFP